MVLVSVNRMHVIAIYKHIINKAMNYKPLRDAHDKINKQRHKYSRVIIEGCSLAVAFFQQKNIYKET